MKITRIETLIQVGSFSSSKELADILGEVKHAISLVTWPVGAKTFTICPEKNGNGVKPLKNNCMEHLRSCGWELEKRLDIATRKIPGPIDAVKVLPDGRSFALEWETGNVSSSHRAMSKMAIGIIKGVLAGGLLIVPSAKLYTYLTDRIGNFPELEPYFDLYKNVLAQNGYFAVVEIEHDFEVQGTPKIPKGTDGRAKI